MMMIYVFSLDPSWVFQACGIFFLSFTVYGDQIGPS